MQDTVSGSSHTAATAEFSELFSILSKNAARLVYEHSARKKKGVQRKRTLSLKILGGTCLL